MTVAHIVLLLIALLMAAEALWAMARPGVARERVGQLLTETEDGAGTWRALFWVLALIMWVFAWYGTMWAHRVLFFIGVYFMGIGFVANRPSFLRLWYELFLGRRSATSIRLIYLGEMLLAATLGWIAARGL